jgi:hypothetical protein
MPGINVRQLSARSLRTASTNNVRKPRGVGYKAAASKLIKT